MNEKEAKLLLYFLDELGEILSNRGCNSIPKKQLEAWTPEERKQFAKEYHELNGDIEEYDNTDDYEYLISDFCAVYLLTDKLRKLLLDKL